MNVVVANTLEVANELLDKRSALYSDRFGHPRPLPIARRVRL